MYTRSRARNLEISLLASKVLCVSVLCCIPYVHRSTIIAQSQDTRSFWPPLPPGMVDVYNGGMDGVSGSRFVSLSLSLSRKVPFWCSIEPSNILQEATYMMPLTSLKGGIRGSLPRPTCRSCLDVWTSCQMAKFDPFLSLDCAGVEGGGSNPRKGRDQILQRSVAEP